MTKTSRRFSIVFPLSLLILSLLYQKECMEGVSLGLKIGLEKAFPALFPALVLSRILTAAIPRSSRKAALFLPFLMGLACGFPVGAQTVKDLRKRGLLSRKDGEKMLFFCSNAGPSFIVGVCGIGVFKSARLGAFLLLLQWSLTLIFFAIFLFKKRKEKSETTQADDMIPPFYKTLAEALKAALSSFFYILSCIVFFSFIMKLIFSFIPASDFAKNIFYLFTEMTGGIFSLEKLPFSISFPLCGAALGWSSLSVHLQTLGVLSDSDLSYRAYLWGRISFAVLMGLGASFLQKLL
ncbi:MAG: hypothetical protein IKT50_00415 [Clostridia bacterium]|nr:hypothetical protein [Clostridia bacterium]